MHTLKARTAHTLAALITAACAVVALATPASANATFGCTASGKSGLHATATRINYGSGSAIYVSATQTWKEVSSLRADVSWSFYRFTATGGLQTRYSNPTQWGSSTNRLDFNTEYVTVTWNGKTTLGSYVTPATCTVRVGV